MFDLLLDRACFSRKDINWAKITQYWEAPSLTCDSTFFLTLLMQVTLLSPNQTHLPRICLFNYQFFLIFFIIFFVFVLVLVFFSHLLSVSRTPLTSFYFPRQDERKGPFKRFQHLLRHAFNTLLNQMSGAFEHVVQHC